MFPVPVLANATVCPLTGLPWASFNVIVTVEVVVPSAVTLMLGDPEMVEVLVLAAPAVKVIPVVTLPKPAGAEMLRVLASAFVDLMVPVA